MIHWAQPFSLSVSPLCVLRPAPLSFILSAREGRSLLHWAYQLPSLVTAATHRALGALATCDCVHRTHFSEPQMLIPPRTHCFEITVRQNSQLPQKNRPLSRYYFIQADNRRLEQTCLTPLVNGNIHTPLTQPARYSADDGILAEIEKHQRRSHLRSNAIRVGKTAKINLAEHRYWAGASDS